MSVYVPLGQGYTDGFTISDDVLNEFLQQPGLNKADVPDLARKFADFVKARGYQLPNINGYDYSSFGNLVSSLGNSSAFADAASQGAAKVYAPGSLQQGQQSFANGTTLYDKSGRAITAQTGQTYDPNTWSTTKTVGASAPSLGITPATSTNTPPATTASATSGAQPPTVDLQPGQSGSQVKQLQDWLVSQGYMTAAQVATGPGTYGPQTTAALAKWQSDHGVATGGNPGYYGPVTMAAVQKAATGTTGAQGGTQGGAAGSDSGAAGGSTGNGGKVTFNPTGNPALDAILSSISGLASNVVSSGYTIPQNLQITPELTQQFLDWAHQNVDPQTQASISNELGGITASLKNMATQYELSKGQAVQDFGTTLATSQNTAGANGVAFSGQRGLEERNLVDSTNRKLASLGASEEQSVGDQLRAGAAAVGGANMAPVTVPGSTVDTVSNMGGSRGSSTYGRTLDFGYDASKYPVGTIPTAGNTTVNNQAGNYLSQYTSLAGANSGRSMRDIIGMMTNLPQNYSITRNI